mgnify:CR=1 FL=1
MIELSLPEIKLEELKILEDVHNMCAQNHITYSMAGGTLLGAVRHHGFIPWDDDIDIVMPRKDYERFIKIYKKSGKYLLFHYSTSPNYPYPFIKVCSQRTFVEEYGLLEKYRLRDMGVWIDIFPSDYVPHPESRILWFKWRMYNYIYRYVPFYWDGSEKKYSPLHKKLKGWKISYLRRRYNDLASLSSQLNKYVSHLSLTPTPKSGCLIWGYGKNEICNSSIWDELIAYDFDGYRFMGFKSDEYLKNLYGDYMKLPPIEKRASSHSFHAFWR